MPAAGGYKIVDNFQRSAAVVRAWLLKAALTSCAVRRLRFSSRVEDTRTFFLICQINPFTVKLWKLFFMRFGRFLRSI